MLPDRRDRRLRLQVRSAWVVATLALFAVPGPTTAQSVRLADAGQTGAFNTGPARATAGRAVDPVAGDVLKLDYSIPPGSGAGLWAKAFPGSPGPDTVEVIHLGVRAEGSGEPGPVAATVEIKGTAGVQRIPLTAGAEWSNREAFVDWTLIGQLNEIVVSVSPPAGGAAAGTLYVDVRLERLSPLRRLSTSPVGRIGGILLLAGIAALLARLAGTGGERPGQPNWHDPTADRPGPLGRDFVRGVAAVLIAGLAIAVYHVGGLGRLEVGWVSLGIAVLGAVLAEWLKWGLTGRHLTPGQVFCNLAATGVPAASASPLALLQAPATWSETLLLSQAAAAAVVAAYHVANFCRINAVGRHLDATHSALVIGAPYVIGGLLLLRANGLLRELGSLLSAGTLDGRPDAAAIAGRVAVVFVFNEVVANALGMATRRTWLRPVAAHLSLFAVAALVVAAPWVAAAGSGERAAALPAPARMVAAIITAAVSQAGLWAEVYLVTGMAFDALRGRPPGTDAVVQHPGTGAQKAVVFGGVFMAVVYVPGLLWEVPAVRSLAESFPVLLAVLAGAFAFPLVKAVIETFDGSQRFFGRVGWSYRKPALYARGAVVGLGVGYAIATQMENASLGTRAGFGLIVGAVAFAGVNLVRDALLAVADRGRVQPVRTYLVQALLGGFIGAAVGFYFDADQVRLVSEKYHRYLTVNGDPKPFGVYPFLSKWGFIDLGPTTGGVSLLFNESLAGVIEWSIPAWLFAINRTFLEAFFRRDIWPVRALFTRGGLIGLTEMMIVVFRWGLWMSPIIKSFLRPMGDPTWYNQDGAIRTVVAAFHQATSSPEDFREWSLNFYIALLAYDGVRIAIWLDHFGLRVATLVNLSFLGMDRLDERLARSLAPASTARSIPEAVKRFTTWAPLLIPFYIPRGADWDRAWSQSQAIQAGHGGDLASWFLARPVFDQAILLVGAVAVSTGIFWLVRVLRRRFGPAPRFDRMLANAAYEITVSQEGAVVGHAPDRGYDVSRRSYDWRDPAGRAVFLVEPGENGGRPPRAWPVVGNYPADVSPPARIGQGDRLISFEKELAGLDVCVEVALTGPCDAAEVWTVTVTNAGDAPRSVGVVPYLEWVLNQPGADRGHTQYNRLFAEVGYVGRLNAVLAWDKHAKAAGVLAADVAPDGFLSVRADFIGRGRSLWAPRVLETLAFSKAEDTAPHATLDPIGSLLVWRTVPPRGSARVRFLVGLAKNQEAAAELVAQCLQAQNGGLAIRDRAALHPIGHGEVPPGTPRPYFEFADEGRRLVVRTPFTPRPWDHTLSNALGHVVSVTNRGLNTSCSVNAQQNRLTPDWPDTVTRELPGESIYLFDPDTNEWYSPTYQPLKDPSAAFTTEFGIDGTATFHMARGTLETELIVFVPPDDPAGFYLLTIRNRGDRPRRLRVAPYFQMVLGEQPESAGPLPVRHDPALNALFFRNPRNRYRWGPAFVAMTHPAERVETRRGHFFGAGRSVSRPTFVESGVPDVADHADDRPVAAFLATVDIPAHGETTLAVLLGQADDRRRAEEVVKKYRDVAAVRAALEETRRWWVSRMDAVRLRTDNPEFDGYLGWLYYQALAVRLWARRGFYQASGAFGFRDQLQDAVNLLWADPTLARRQIILHAGRQFLEGDVAHWFHVLPDGRTGLVGRTYASDTLVWLPWAVVEYLAATGDDTVLDERAPYLEADQPLPPLPGGKGGMGFEPLHPARDDDIYRHCLLALDLVLDRRMGAHGLPLMLCGDWNDGLDEIGSEGRGESIWLGFFLLYVLERFTPVVGQREGAEREAHYRGKARRLREALEETWRGDRYLRAIHDDGTEIGVAGSGIWEIDALTAAWAVSAGMDPARTRTGFDTAVRLLEQETTILLGRPPLREDTKPYLGRSSWYPEGVRENGMYCHGVQWLVGAARLLAHRFEREGNPDEARRYRDTAYRLWLKTAAYPHATLEEVETYGGQPNQQAADLVTTFDPGRMIWNGYTGAAGWMFRQAFEGVLGYRLDRGAVVAPEAPAPDGLGRVEVRRGESRVGDRSNRPEPEVGARATTADAEAGF